MNARTHRFADRWHCLCCAVVISHSRNSRGDTAAAPAPEPPRALLGLGGVGWCMSEGGRVDRGDLTVSTADEEVVATIPLVIVRAASR